MQLPSNTATLPPARRAARENAAVRLSLLNQLFKSPLPCLTDATRA
ncbi:protein of unknown function [Pseudomonas sp. JV241A]|nr:protein of unknown function [Pseudomonas sp. JV241A]